MSSLAPPITDPIAQVSLRALSDDNRNLVLRLAVAPEQADLVASNQSSLDTIDAEATSVGRVIVAGEDIVGLIVYETLEDDGRSDEVSIYRLMIDARYQQRGFGRAAMRLLIAELGLSASHFTKVWISYVPGNAVARAFYASLGFVETGLDDDGEILALLNLKAQDRGEHFSS